MNADIGKLMDRDRTPDQEFEETVVSLLRMQPIKNPELQTRPPLNDDHTGLHEDRPRLFRATVREFDYEGVRIYLTTERLVKLFADALYTS
jgi:hypothetical protein